MKRIDIRFSTEDIEMLKSVIGRKINCIKCDPFVFSTDVYGIVGIQIEDKWLALTNFVEVLDYYGSDEDVGVFRISEVDADQIYSCTGNDMISIPIESIIANIEIVDENQRLYKCGTQIYDVWVTRGIIIKLDDGREVSFEKDVWLSEDIIVERGESLIDKFSSTTEFADGWEGQNEYTAVCERNIASLK